MNLKVVSFLKNISMTLFSNIFALLISTGIILFVPKIIGVTEFGYWQLYLFYTTYIGLVSLGLPDGIYLKYGGAKYSSLDKSELAAQYKPYFIFQMFIAVVLLILTFFYKADLAKRYVLQATIICMLFTNTRQFFICLIQTTNRFRDFTVVTVAAKAISIVIIISAFAFGNTDFRIVIASDVMGVILSFTYVLFKYREILGSGRSFSKQASSMFFENISVGIKVILAYFAGVMIVGIVRFGIENAWDITTFGKVSMTLSISSLMMVFIQAISVVIFPMLKSENKLNYSVFYKTIQPLVMLLLIIMLIIYYPLYLFMNAWLPQYSSSMIYLAYLFPIFIFEGKKSLLTNTFLKVIRFEKDILLANIVAVIVSLITTVVFTIIYHNLTLAVLSITVVTALSAYVSEWLLARRMNITIISSALRELFVCSAFVVVSSLLNIRQAFFIVLVIIAIYILSDFKQLKQSVKYVISSMK